VAIHEIIRGGLLVRIDNFGMTDVGRVRKINEDALILMPELAFFAVADGMGGEEKGEVASRIFVETAPEVFSHGSLRSEQERVERVREAFVLANEKILSWAKANRVGRMGCTAELIVFSDSNYALGHVGDSRTYCFRRGNLRQLTRDHSLVQAQVDQGFLSPAEAQRSPLRNIILRSVGTEETLTVDLLRGKTQPGDIYLLCSDGLTGMVDDGAIRDTLFRPLELSVKAQRLADQANLAGGYDNITVVLCQVPGSARKRASNSENVHP
jgi:protein phosphatase